MAGASRGFQARSVEARLQSLQAGGHVRNARAAPRHFLRQTVLRLGRGSDTAHARLPLRLRDVHNTGPHGQPYALQTGGDGGRRNKKHAPPEHLPHRRFAVFPAEGGSRIRRKILRCGGRPRAEVFRFLHHGAQFGRGVFCARGRRGRQEFLLHPKRRSRVNRDNARRQLGARPARGVCGHAADDGHKLFRVFRARARLGRRGGLRQGSRNMFARQDNDVGVFHIFPVPGLSSLAEARIAEQDNVARMAQIQRRARGVRARQDVRAKAARGICELLERILRNEPVEESRADGAERLARRRA